MIAALLSLLGSSAVGSLIGGVFAFMNRKADIDARKMDLEHEEKRWGHELAVKRSDLEIAQAEAQGKLNVAVVEAEGLVDSARMQAIAKANEADKTTAGEINAAGKLGWVFVLASAFNKVIRPVLTVILAGAALFLNWLVIDKLTANWGALTPVQQFETGMQAFAWVTAQSSMAFSYWFVSRGIPKR